MLQALDISRNNSSHFENVASYWCWNIDGDCDDCGFTPELDSISNVSVDSSSRQETPSLSTMSSCQSSENSSVKKSLPMMRGDKSQSEPESEESEELHG